MSSPESSLKFPNIFVHISGFIEPITLIKVSVKRSFPFNVLNLSTDEANFGRPTQGPVRIQKKGKLPETFDP